MNNVVRAILTDPGAFALAEECIHLKRRLVDKLTAFDELIEAMYHVQETVGEIREVDVAKSLAALHSCLLAALDDLETNRTAHALRARSRIH
ncbi:MAG: hypothetical protein Q8O33_11195 [Pseudomonadota bacterium]|nr:hypothetical protein [Pseudomonadota bacterium]